MAAIAINQPTEMRKYYRANAPKTGGVRLDMKEHSTLSEQEQMELIALQKDIGEIWETNHSLANKLKSMEEDEAKMKKLNAEMEGFFKNIPAGNLTATIGTQTDIEETDPDVWKEKERKLQYEVIQQQKDLIADLKSEQPVVPKGLWGHKSRIQNESVQQKSSQKSSKRPSWKSPQSSSKPVSIPFRPKPLHLMVRKAYLRPPPKLPPAHSHTYYQPTARLPKCGALQQCDDNINIVFRERFAEFEALERAINSHEQTVSDVPGDSWADHPYYDGPEHEEDAAVPNDACKEEAWEDHPYYDDLCTSESDQGATDELENLGHGEDQDESQLPDEAAPDDAAPDDAEEVAWEEHPYYDAPDEESSHAESDVPEEDASLQDHSSYTTTEEEDEVAWEDSPYY